MNKPIVHYSGLAKFRVWPWLTHEDGSDIVVGYLDIVHDHPRLSKCYNVRTSEVIKSVDNEGTFETLNTIYKRYEPSETN